MRSLWVIIALIFAILCGIVFAFTYIYPEKTENIAKDVVAERMEDRLIEIFPDLAQPNSLMSRQITRIWQEIDPENQEAELEEETTLLERSRALLSRENENEIPPIEVQSTESGSSSLINIIRLYIDPACTCQAESLNMPESTGRFGIILGRIALHLQQKSMTEYQDITQKMILNIRITTAGLSFLGFCFAFSSFFTSKISRKIHNITEIIYAVIAFIFGCTFFFAESFFFLIHTSGFITFSPALLCLIFFIWLDATLFDGFISKTISDICSF